MPCFCHFYYSISVKFLVLLASIKYGIKIDFLMIERKLSLLREGDATTFKGLETITREDLWPFATPIIPHVLRLPKQARMIPQGLLHRGIIRQERRIDNATLI